MSSTCARFARTGPGAYLYYFTRISPFARRLGAGVMHEAEVPYVMGYLSGEFPRLPAGVPPFEETDRTLSNAMAATWVRFARAGDPNGEGLPAWPPVGRKANEYLEFGDEIRPGHVDGERLRRLDFVAGYFSRLRGARSVPGQQPRRAPAASAGNRRPGSGMSCVHRPCMKAGETAVTEETSRASEDPGHR